jgi:FXSXX-COOH protein
MSPQSDTKAGPVSAVVDVRRVPLNRLSTVAGDSLRRIVPPEDTERVSVAAFNASL